MTTSIKRRIMVISCGILGSLMSLQAQSHSACSYYSRISGERCDPGLTATCSYIEGGCNMEAPVTCIMDPQSRIHTKLKVHFEKRTILGVCQPDPKVTATTGKY